MKLLLVYLLLINAAGLLLMLADKIKARKNLWRIPEATLFLIAALGGSIGSIDREGSVHNLSSVLIGCSGQNDEVLTVKGSASDLTISGGIPVYMSSYEYPVRVDIAENTLVNNLTVDRLGYVNVSSGAVVSNVNLLSSGVLNVLSGGTASVIFDPWNQTRAHAEEGAVVINQRDYNVYIGTYKLLSRTNEVLDGLTISSGSSALIYEGDVS